MLKKQDTTGLLSYLGSKISQNLDLDYHFSAIEEAMNDVINHLPISAIVSEKLLSSENCFGDTFKNIEQYKIVALHSILYPHYQYSDSYINSLESCLLEQNVTNIDISKELFNQYYYPLCCNDKYYKHIEPIDIIQRQNEFESSLKIDLGEVVSCSALTCNHVEL